MPKSKSTKNHKERLARYKANKKKEQDNFKKKMIDQYIKMQQQAVADKETHTSTQEVSGPDINIDELNQIEESVNIDNAQIVNEINIDVEPIIDSNDDMASFHIEPNIDVEPIQNIQDDNDNK
jgi:hypothetical protein